MPEDVRARGPERMYATALTWLSAVPMLPYYHVQAELEVHPEAILGALQYLPPEERYAGCSLACTEDFRAQSFDGRLWRAADQRSALDSGLSPRLQQAASH